jgi:hypothetical protein
MKKSELKSDLKYKEIPFKYSWNQFKDLNREQIREIIEAHDRILVYTKQGDFYEIKELEI